MNAFESLRDLLYVPIAIFVALFIIYTAFFGVSIYNYITQQITQQGWDIVTVITTRDHLVSSYVKLYLADTLDKMMEGYKNKSSYDFENKNALGILFLLYRYYKDHVCITMSNVRLNLTVFIADLDIKIREETYMMPIVIPTGHGIVAVPIAKKEYHVINSSIKIVKEYDLKPGNEICVSLKNISKPIMIELDPKYADVFRKASEIYIVKEDAKKIAFK